MTIEAIATMFNPRDSKPTCAIVETDASSGLLSEVIAQYADLCGMIGKQKRRKPRISLRVTFPSGTRIIVQTIVEEKTAQIKSDKTHPNSPFSNTTINTNLEIVYTTVEEPASNTNLGRFWADWTNGRAKTVMGAWRESASISIAQMEAETPSKLGEKIAKIHATVNPNIGKNT